MLVYSLVPGTIHSNTTLLIGKHAANLCVANTFSINLEIMGRLDAGQ